MLRAVKLSLKFATAAKRKRLERLKDCYRAAVNFYLDSGVDRLSAENVYRLKNSRLSLRYLSNACRDAVSIRNSTLKAHHATGKPLGRVPEFKGDIKLDAKFVTIETGNGSFDLVIKLSCLDPGKRLVIPTKATKVLRKWLAVPRAELVQGACLGRDHLVVWVELPDLPPKAEGRPLGIDLGVNKLISTSDGQFIGTGFKQVRDKICRRKPGSKGRHRALTERDNLTIRSINQLPWKELNLLCVEDLKGIKHGKRSGRGRQFRRKLSPWAAAKVVNRIRQVAEQNRVCVRFVDPAYTSQCCPSCRTVSKDNRLGESFRCVNCGHSADADQVGAQNVLFRGLGGNFGASRVPRTTKTCLAVKHS